MTPTCGSLTKNITFDCDEPLVAGARDRLILVNFDEKGVVLRNALNPLIVESFLLIAGGAQGFQYDGKNNSNEPSFSLVKKDFAEVYEHIVKFKVFTNNGDDKKELELMAKGRVIAFVENHHLGADGDSAFEIYGLDTGLILSVHTRTVADDATQGAHDLELKSSEKSPEPHPPASFFKTDFATTKALVDSILVPTT